MAIRNNKIGGNDWTGGEVLYSQDLNDTFDTTIDKIDETKKIGIGVAQNAYQTLKQSGSFDNKDFLAADEFITEEGTNETVDTGSSSAGFDTNHYSLKAYPDYSSHTDANYIYNSSFSNVNNAYDFNNTTYAYATGVSSAKFGKIFSDFNNITKIIIKASFNTGSYSDNKWIDLQYYDGSTWNTIERLTETTGTSLSYTDTYTFTSPLNCKGIRLYLNGSSTSGTTFKFYIYDFEYEFILNNGVVVCNTNTLTLDGTEQSLLIYADKDTPENTDITVDISDGTNSITGQPINSVIDISSLSSGNLELTFNLSTTDTSVMPKLYGYGVYIMR